ncbi:MULTISPECIES: VOC family protein [unclassified Ruegeria]|uniref:bleomycin resistance protein n=1 Tax=unclassified Ruegeria TaxID=2625375 RepID=UPI001487AA5A|nr:MULTISPECIES: VOC family protein [unclassified Ruegeria]NOD34164.1 VOC family protein [Ruegeria sp. HKCCD7296]NOE41188.1 VOC family protein [Ruegeria sp. HKCCD7319]
MPEILQLTPFVLCSSLQNQIDFYCKRLGFTCGFRQDNYAFLSLGPVAIRLLECPPRPDGRPLGDDQSFYIDVDDVDGLYESRRAGLADLPKGRVRPPFDQPYLQREFHVLDEDGTLVFFGQDIRPRA